MPEDKKPVDNAGAAPAFDAAAFLTQVEETVGKAIDARVQANQPAITNPYDQGAQPAQHAEPAADGDPIGDMVRPYVDKALQPVLAQARSATLQAQAAMDAQAFYRDHPEAIKRKDEIEGAFGRLMSSGSPFVREDIYAWLRGRNFDKEVESHLEHKEAERKAAAAGTIGAGSPGFGTQSSKDPYEMTDDELKQAIAGKVF